MTNNRVSVVVSEDGMEEGPALVNHPSRAGEEQVMTFVDARRDHAEQCSASLIPEHEVAGAKEEPSHVHCGHAWGEFREHRCVVDHAVEHRELVAHSMPIRFFQSSLTFLTGGLGFDGGQKSDELSFC